MTIRFVPIYHVERQALIGHLKYFRNRLVVSRADWQMVRPYQQFPESGRRRKLYTSNWWTEMKRSVTLSFTHNQI